MRPCDTAERGGHEDEEQETVAMVDHRGGHDDDRDDGTGRISGA